MKSTRKSWQRRDRKSTAMQQRVAARTGKGAAIKAQMNRVQGMRIYTGVWRERVIALDAQIDALTGPRRDAVNALAERAGTRVSPHAAELVVLFLEACRLPEQHREMVRARKTLYDALWVPLGRRADTLTPLLQEAEEAERAYQTELPTLSRAWHGANALLHEAEAEYAEARDVLDDLAGR